MEHKESLKAGVCLLHEVGMARLLMAASELVGASIDSSQYVLQQIVGR